MTADEQQLAIVTLVRTTLGAHLLGAYLHGSAVMGGMRPTSDVDVLVVAQRSLTDDQRAALVDGLLDVSGRRARRGPARPVELTVVVASDVRPWRYPPRADFQYGEWLRDDYERGAVPAAETSPDVAVLITMTLIGNHALLGPAPAALLDPVPESDLRRAIVEGVPDLLADLESDTRNVLLTLARIWSTLATGEITSKDAAAGWAIEHLAGSDRAVLAAARDAYLEGIDEPDWAGRRPAVRACADAIVREIERLGSERVRASG